MIKDSSFRAYHAMLIGIVIVQAGLSAIYIGAFVVDVFGLRTTPPSWQFDEAVQVLTIFGLSFGTLLGAVLLKNFARQRKNLEARLQTASGQFNEVMWGRFKQWGLTPSESDVALFAIKGFTNAEIAEMRGKSIGTVKAQSNSVFRKAGVNGRAQLVSLFIEDLTGNIGENPDTGR